MPGVFTIQAAAPSVGLTTLANAKQELNVTTTTDDAYIGSLITRASRLIATTCGRPFGYQTISEVFRFGWQPGIGPASQQVAPYGTPLQTQYRPLIFSFVPVVQGTETITENGTELAAGTDYEADYAAGIFWRLRNGLRSWWGVPEVDAVYVAGYLLPNDTAPAAPTITPPSLPDDVEAVCLALVAAGYTGRGRDPTVYQENVQGVGQTTYQRGTVGSSVAIANMHIDDSLSAMLEPYRIQAF